MNEEDQRQQEHIERLEQDHQDCELSLMRVQVTLLVADQENVEKAQARFKELEQEISKLKTQDEDFRREIISIKGQEESMQNGKEDKVERIKEMRLNMRELTGKISDSEVALREMQKELSETERNFDDINNQLEQYEKMVSSSQYRQEGNLTNQLILQKKQELSSADLNISILNEKLKAAESQLRSAETKKEDLLREIAQANDEKDDKEIKVQELKKNTNSLMARRMQVQDSLNQKKNELTALNRRKEGFCIFGRPSSTEIAAKNDEVQQLEKEKNELNNEIKEKERDHRIAVEKARKAEATWQRCHLQLARVYSDMYSFSCKQSELEIEMENANMTRRELARNIAHIDCELELGRDSETRIKERIESLKEQKKDYRKKANDLRYKIKGKRTDIMILKAEQTGKENELKNEDNELVKMKKGLREIVENIRETETIRNTISSKIGSLELEKRTVKETIDRTQNEVQTAKDRARVVAEEQNRITQQRESMGVNVVQAQMERRNRRAEERLRISSSQVNSDLVKYT